METESSKVKEYKPSGVGSKVRLINRSFIYLVMSNGHYFSVICFTTMAIHRSLLLLVGFRHQKMTFFMTRRTSIYVAVLQDSSGKHARSQVC